MSDTNVQQWQGRSNVDQHACVPSLGIRCSHLASGRALRGTVKRTQRNLSIIMSVMVVIYLLLIRLPSPIAIGLFAVLAAVAVILALLAYDFFIARYQVRRHRWAKAAERFQKFEKKLVAARWRRVTVLVYFGFYTFDALAIVRNQIAECLINLDDFDKADRWLKAALDRDLQYPVPFVNLGAIAAINRDRVTAHRQMSRAVHLGFSPTIAERILHRAAARGNAKRTLDGDSPG